MKDKKMTKVKTFQELGKMTKEVRGIDSVGPSGVEPLRLDSGKSFADSMESFREVLDEYYSEHLDELGSDDENVIVERLVVTSDDLPYVEYQLVDDK